MSTALALQHTDQNRFAELMERSYRKVYNLAYRLSMNKQDAEDLTQEAYFRAYRNFQDYEGDRPFENWIFRIVTRLFLDLNRARKRRVQTVSYDAPRRADGMDDALLIESADSNPSAELQMMTNTFSEEVDRALNTLKPEQRLLVILADVEQMPYNEIAAIAGVPVGTVRSRLHRAHRKLRDVLEKGRKEPAAPKNAVPRTATLCTCF